MNGIHKAADLIRKGGLSKRAYIRGASFCALGALGCSAVNSPLIQNLVADVVREQYPERIETLPLSYLDRYLDCATIVTFNDHPDTTKDDVVAVLEKAAIKLDERA